ncbi:hypothetical protein [Halegenticoccus tardaugens]|uniref:hypothetical protein n=1 Tax=Halegenticoccus tardaugens TaxID=2071624 RepID=UPI00100AD5EF|nr:hypothetical protein [Halegenticoccus tardaugens]
MRKPSRSGRTEPEDDALEELRREYDRQVDQLRDINDKAMRSVRTAILIAGFIIAAVGITTREGDVVIGWIPVIFSSIGLLLLAGTVFIGSSTYLVTEYPGQFAQRRLQSGQFRTQKDELIQMYRRWTKLNSQEIDKNNTYVFYTVSSIFLGVLLLLIAGLQVAIPNLLPTCVPPGGVLCFKQPTVELSVAEGIIILTTLAFRFLFSDFSVRRGIGEFAAGLVLWLMLLGGTELLLSIL